MPQTCKSTSLYDGMSACMTEARQPREGEVEKVAAKMWRDAYAARSLRAWDHVAPGSAERERLLAAARIALDPPPCPDWKEDAVVALDLCPTLQLVSRNSGSATP